MEQQDQCPECKGTGVTNPEGYLHLNTMTYTACDNCDGMGYLPRCRKCGELLQHVRPGKWQCNGEHSGNAS